MGKKIREKIKPWLLQHNALYQCARTTHRIYCEMTYSFHTLPDFLIIGAPKSGTSSLYDYLIKHPSIFSAVVKEPNYFAMYYNNSLAWYSSCFPSTLTKYYTENIKKKKFMTGEASTQYYWYPHAAKRVKKDVPNAKIIMLMRNPIDRSYSQYNMEYRNRNEDLSFEDAIDSEKERVHEEYEKILKNEYYFSPKYTAKAYLAKSIYVDLIEKWLDYFPREQFLFIKSEDFFHDTTRILNEILDFLGLPEMQLSKYEIIREGHYQKMKPETRRKLVEFFKPHNERLYKLLGRNFHWDK